jgi:hypothetical protein
MDVFVCRVDTSGGNLGFSTYVGGPGNDVGYGIALSRDGSIVVAGKTTSGTISASMGARQSAAAPNYDVFIFGLAPSGNQILWSTTFGGSGDDMANYMALDVNQHVVVAGETRSRDLPLTAGTVGTRFSGGATDGFVARFSIPLRQPVSAAYLGGAGDDRCSGISTDEAGTIYVCGITASTDLAVSGDAVQSRFAGGRTDGFLAVLDSTCTRLQYGSYFGGSGDDVAEGIGVSSSGMVYLAGNTTSQDLPVTAVAHDRTPNGGNDLFVVGINIATSTLAFCTYAGGTSDDLLESMIIDRAGNPVLTGLTYSEDFPVTPGSAVYQGAGDALVVQLDRTGERLLHSLLLGGDSLDVAYALAATLPGGVVVTGRTQSVNFPATPGTSGGIYRGGTEDAFVAHAALDNSTFPLILRRGWNLFSLPVQPNSLQVHDLLPRSPVGFCIAWSDTHYVETSALECHTGFWTYSLTGDTMEVGGAPLTSFTVDVTGVPEGQYRWKLIGSLTQPGAVLTANPPDAIASPFYLLTYDGERYAFASSIEPGFAYWVKVIRDCTLTVAPPSGER